MAIFCMDPSQMLTKRWATSRCLAAHMDKSSLLRSCHQVPRSTMGAQRAPVKRSCTLLAFLAARIVLTGGVMKERPGSVLTRGVWSTWSACPKKSLRNLGLTLMMERLRVKVRGKEMRRLRLNRLVKKKVRKRSMMETALRLSLRKVGKIRQAAKVTLLQIDLATKSLVSTIQLTQPSIIWSVD